MHRRILSAILAVFLTVVCYPDLIQGQSTDSLLYLIENDLVTDDAEKYKLLCEVIAELDNDERKIRYSDQAIELAQKLDILPALPYLMKGEVYLTQGDYVAAFGDLIKAADYFEELGELSDVARAHMLMAELYNALGNRENEKLYLQNVIEVFEREQDTYRLAVFLNNLGYLNYSMGQYDTALVVFTKTLDLFKELNDIPYYFVCLGNSGLAYSGLSDFDKAEEYLVTAIDTLVSLEYEMYVPEFLIGYAKIQHQKGKTEQAIAYASRALKITDNPVYERDASLLLSRIYEISGRIDSAYYYQSKFIIANDRINNEEIIQKTADQRFAYEVGRIQAEVDLLNKVKQRNRIIIIGLGIILILAIWLVTSYYYNLKRSRKLTVALEERRVILENQSSELKVKNERIISANDELTVLNESISKQNAQIVEANEELTVLNEAISKQNSEIRDSISYAQRIQAAMMPPEQYFHEVLNDVFILFKPRDIVSGDFFWIKQVKQYVILAAADCTGHGVPGAFMSLLGISFLNEIVQRREITQANQVLNELRRQIRNSLRQHGQAEESKDGIDMALCVIDEKNNTLQYSGANNPLYLIRDQNGAPELTEFKADRMPLGYYQGTFKTFANQDIQLEYGDVFYLFSDGFVDQKGGKDNKKFMSRKFKNLLLKIHQEPMQEQKKILDKTINDWMGDHSQIDDILVIGVRV
jgi:serine phosphatase RsbU (regulator of sigma subunit)/Tfp pilus assembly protein PilF